MLIYQSDIAISSIVKDFTSVGDAKDFKAKDSCERLSVREILRNIEQLASSFSTEVKSFAQELIYSRYITITQILLNSITSIRIQLLIVEFREKLYITLIATDCQKHIV